MIDKTTQIKALLGGSAYDFACQTLGVYNMRDSKYSDVFTVTERQVHEYVFINGFPNGETPKEERDTEGFHFYQERGTWHTWYKERNIVSDEIKFEDSRKAKRYIATTLLRMAGTGVY